VTQSVPRAAPDTYWPSETNGPPWSPAHRETDVGRRCRRRAILAVFAQTSFPVSLNVVVPDEVWRTWALPCDSCAVQSLECVAIVTPATPADASTNPPTRSVCGLDTGVKRRPLGWRAVTRPRTRVTTTVLSRTGLRDVAQAGDAAVAANASASAVTVKERRARSCMSVVIIMTVPVLGLGLEQRSGQGRGALTSCRARPRRPLCQLRDTSFSVAPASTRSAAARGHAVCTRPGTRGRAPCRLRPVGRGCPR
jgi:hypothetical protein